MKAAIITKPGGPEVLELRDVAMPTPGSGEVRVRVRASALNRADLLQRRGAYPAPPGAPTDIPGLEIAGDVEALGPGVSRWRTGERVFGIVAGGGHAEYVVVREDEIARVPNAMSWDDAGAVPEAFMTAHDALVTQARMQPGERVVIHAVGSGVGLAALQLVRALGGEAIGTARTCDKLDRAREYGLAKGILVSDSASLASAIGEATNGAGADVVLDLVGGPYLAASVASAAPQGRIILIGLLGGRSADVDLGAVLSRRLTIRGTVLRTRSPEEKAAVTAAFARDVVPLLERGTVRAVVDRVFPLAEIGAAHRLMESNQTFGKLVVRM